MPVADSTTQWVTEKFTSSIVPTLVDYIKIPNKSAMFDPDWKKNGHMDKASDSRMPDAYAVHLPADR